MTDIDSTSAGFAAAVAEAIREVEAAWNEDHHPRVDRVFFKHDGESEPYHLLGDGYGGFFLAVES